MTSNKNLSIHSRSGQSLIEVIIGLAVAASLIGAAVLAIMFVLRSGAANQKYQIAAGLNRELADKIKTVVSASWNDLYIRNKGFGTQYHVVFEGGRFIFKEGATSTNIEGTSFLSFFSVENVYRDVSQNIVEEANGTEDPSTQKVTVYTKWPEEIPTAEIKTTDYLTRWVNAVFRQTDWSAGAVAEPPLLEAGSRFATSSNIDFSSDRGAIKIQGF